MVVIVFMFCCSLNEVFGAVVVLMFVLLFKWLMRVVVVVGVMLFMLEHGVVEMILVDLGAMVVVVVVVVVDVGVVVVAHEFMFLILLGDT